LAVYQLGTCDWRSNPQVVQLLLTTAREDPAAMVRAAAVGTLGRMGVTTEAVQAACHQLKSDADPRVRQEAEQALIRCSGTNTGGGIQPVSGR
jgi:HEAT repeat protein